MTLTQNGKKTHAEHTVQDCYATIRESGLRPLLAGRKQVKRRIPVLGLSDQSATLICPKKEEIGEKVKVSLNAPAFTHQLEASAVITGVESVPEKNVYKVNVAFRRIAKRDRDEVNSIAEDPLMRAMKTNAKSC